MSDEIDKIEEEEDKPKKKKLLVFGLFGLVILAGIAVYYLLIEPSGDEVQKSGEVKEEVIKVSPKEIEVTDPASVPVILGESPVFIKIGPVVSNISAPDRYEYIQVSMSIKTYHPDLMALLAPYEVYLKSIIQYEVREMDEVMLLSNVGIEKLTLNIRLKLNQILKELNIDIKYIDEFLLSDVIIE
jgi:flagellar basal body-associated protein FliL